MRRIALCVAALLLSACGQPHDTPDHEAAPTLACVRTATQPLAWSNPDAPDAVSVRAEGPTCKQAALFFVVRDAQGAPLWTHASTYAALSAGAASENLLPDVSETEMDAFLQNWARVTMQHANQLPEWRAGEAGPSAAGQPLHYVTTLQRDAYETLRHADAPTICYAAAVATTQCVAIDPQTRAPRAIASYGP